MTPSLTPGLSFFYVVPLVTGSEDKLDSWQVERWTNQKLPSSTLDINTRQPERPNTLY